MDRFSVSCPIDDRSWHDNLMCREVGCWEGCSNWDAHLLELPACLPRANAVRRVVHGSTKELSGRFIPRLFCFWRSHYPYVRRRWCGRRSNMQPRRRLVLPIHSFRRSTSTSVAPGSSSAQLVRGWWLRCGAASEPR
jgi:hypothetical protein